MNTDVAAQRKVLLIEDDDDLRESLAEVLVDGRHEVVAVSGGREGLRRMRTFQPDIVVLDLMMPAMDGWSFRVEQRRDPALADTPVIAISANHSSTAAAIDADLFLQKPLDARQLLQAVDDVLHVQELRRDAARRAQTERLAALGTLAAGVAHEINNPLTYVLLHLTNVDRLLAGLATASHATELDLARTLVQGALEGVERIRVVSRSIRTFSRTEEDDLTPVDLHRPMDAALRLIENELRHKARLVTRYHETPRVLASEGRLAQVFLNLLSNAVQAIPEGDVDGNEVRVLTGTNDEGEAYVEVGDTGPGIPEHLRGRIFEPFFTTKPFGQGTGLGLSISHGIVRALAGDLELASELGRGTTFRVTLPAAPATAVPSARVGASCTIELPAADAPAQRAPGSAPSPERNR